MFYQHDPREDEHDPWWVMVNVEAGHSATCSYAGAGDCTCPKGNVVEYIVTAVVDGIVEPIEVTRDLEKAKRVARTASKVMNRVRLRALRGHVSCDIFSEGVDAAWKRARNFRFGGA